MNGKLLLSLFLIYLCSISLAKETIYAKQRTFSIENDTFVMDGKPFRYISGTLHYFRVMPSSWRDRLRKMKYAGLNAVQTYTIWSYHEPEIGSYDFTGRLDVVRFIEIAQEEGLYVILRPGPYIDAEVDMGGLPYWLLREYPKMKLRTSDPKYIKYVNTWMTIILERVEHLLYQNGGPIIMIQVENEYGSYHACDFKYTSYLRDLTKKILGNDVFLFTTDGASADYLKCGKIAGVYATVDFGTGWSIRKAFEAQRLFEPTGPLVNSEFYTGWLDHYGKPHSTVNGWLVSFYLDEMLAMGASVNLYVFNGGTSFGAMAGSNIIDGQFLSCPTSYDYDAPMNEAGDLTDKYFMIRNVTRKYVVLPSGTVTNASQKHSYGHVDVSFQGDGLQLLKYLKQINNTNPLTFEALSVANGIVVYQTIIKHLTWDPSLLTLEDVRDRAYIYLDYTYIGVSSRDQKAFSIGIRAKPQQVLTIIVESMGRVCFGEDINDWKGIKGVKIAGIDLEDWNMIPFPLESTNKMVDFLSTMRISVPSKIPTRTTFAFFEGSFTIPSNIVPQDTFLKLQIWSKGYVWINDFLLGRYWPAIGPQMTLYVPAELLRNGENVIRIFELEAVDCKNDGDCFVEFVSSPTIDGRTPYYL